MSARTTTAGGRVMRRLGDHLLTLLAVGGAVCILLVILSWVFSISIMMFRTGSMSPTISAGSIAFVREIPAAEIDEGDVVTVDRGESVLPVTHRVTELRAHDPATGEVTFIMQGDANDTADPEPYTATEVRRVMFAVPGAARVVQLMGDPRVLAGLTIGAALLVVWAFWPRRGSPDGAEPETVSDPADGADLSAPRAVALPALAALILAAPGAGDAETTLITGEHLRLQTTGDLAQMQNLAPGQSVPWEVGVWAEAPGPGEIRIGLAGRGELAAQQDALLVAVEACPTPWDGTDCAERAQTVLERTPLDQLGSPEATHHLITMDAAEQRWLRITVTLSASAADLDGAHGELLVEAVGAGEHLTTDDPPHGPGGDTGGGAGSDSEGGPGGDLARTGAASTLPLTLAASALLISGTALALRARRRH